jgi:hypothetical protein
MAKQCAGISGVSLKATRGWCEKFMKREGLSLRRVTVGQKLLSVFETKLTDSNVALLVCTKGLSTP